MHAVDAVAALEDVMACRSGQGSRQQRMHAATALEGHDRTSEWSWAAAAAQRWKTPIACQSGEGQGQHLKTIWYCYEPVFLSHFTSRKPMGNAGIILRSWATRLVYGPTRQTLPLLSPLSFFLSSP